MHDNKRTDDSVCLSIGTLIRYILTGICGVVFIFLVIMLVKTYNQYKEEEAKYIVQGEVCLEIIDDTNALIEELNANTLPPTPTIEPTKEPNGTKNPTSSKKPEKTPAPTKQPAKKTQQILKDTSKDIVGWIKIPGTKVDYPVMQTDNNSYYLDHNFKGKSSAAGSIFMYAENEFTDENISIYGHHMNNKNYEIMFSQLVKYYDKDYMQSHSKILFSDDYEALREYKVLCVMHINKEAVKINYMRTVFPSEIIFNAYIDQLKTYSTTWNDNVTCAYGDRMITLITCDRSKYGSDGRCVVIAVRKPTQEEIEQDKEKPTYQ